MDEHRIRYQHYQSIKYDQFGFRQLLHFQIDRNPTLRHTIRLSL